MDTEQAIAAEVKAARRLAGKTQAEVAAFLGIETDTYSKREQARTPFKAVELYRIASFVGVHPASLYPSISLARPE